MSQLLEQSQPETLETIAQRHGVDTETVTAALYELIHREPQTPLEEDVQAFVSAIESQL